MRNQKLFIVNILTLFFLCIFNTSQAQEKINFLEGSFTEVLKTANQQKKPIMYMFYATWCGHCDKMKKETLIDPEVVQYFNKNYVCAWQDMEVGQGPMLRKKYEIKSYPAFLFFDTLGVLVSQILGEFKPSDLIKEAQNALIPEKQIPYLKKQFEKDVSNAQNCLDYIMALRKGRMDFDGIAQRYFETVEEKDLLSEMNWKIFANGIMDIQSREFKYVLSHQKEFADLISKTRVERKLTYTINEYLKLYADAGDTLIYEKRKNKVLQTQYAKLDSIVYANDMLAYEKSKSWDKYAAAAQKFTKEFYWNNQSKLKEIAENIANHVSDKSSLLKAAEWAERALELRELFDTYMICAKAYSKMGETEKAKQFAQKGKELAIKNKSNYAEAEQYLK
jgi:thioredoxin-related protein